MTKEQIVEGTKFIYKDGTYKISKSGKIDDSFYLEKKLIGSHYDYHASISGFSDTHILVFASIMGKIFEVKLPINECEVIED